MAQLNDTMVQGDLRVTGNIYGNISGNAATASAAQSGSALETAINGKASSTHTHGNIANGGTLTDTAAAAAGNDYVVIRDADNAKIQTSTIKGTDVADAVSKKHSHSTLTLSTTAQKYDGSHTLALPSTDPYTSARTPASHSHGNIANGGTLSDTAAAAAGNDYVVIRDADNAKIQTSTIKGTDVADAVSKKHSHSTLTLSTTAQAYDGSHTLALPSSDPYTSARTPASHTHGNIANGGTLTDTAAAAAGNDYVVIRDADNSKIQTSTIKGTDVADAVSKKHSHSTLTLSTTAQKYDGSHTLALPSTDPYTSARTPASHSHGNIANGGTLQTNDITIASGDKLVVTDSSDSNKVARTSVSFDGSTTTKALTQKGTFETFLTSHQNISGKADLANTSQTILSEPSQADGSKYLIVSQTTFGGSASSAWHNYDLSMTIQSRHSGSGLAVIQCNINTGNPTETGLTGTINIFTTTAGVRISSPLIMYRKYDASAYKWTVTVVVSCSDYNNFKIKSILSQNGLSYSTSCSYVTDLSTLGTQIATALTASNSNHTHTTSIASDSSSGTVVSLAHNTQYKLTAGGTSVLFKTPSDSNTDTKVTQTADNTSSGTGFEVLFSATGDNTTRTEESRKSNKLTFQPSTGTLTATKFSGPLTGNVTGNCSGSSGSCTGNAATATSATTATNYASSGGIATALDGKVDYEYVSDPSVIDSNSTAASCKTYLVNNVSPGRCQIVYNKNGDEYTLIFSRQHSGTYGSIIKYGYANNTIYMLRYKNTKWESTDWEVISAGSVNATTGNSITSTGSNGSMEILNGALNSASGGGGSCSIDGDGISFTQGVSGTSMTAASIATSGTGTFTEGASAKGRPIDGSATIVTNSSLTWNAATPHLVVNRSAGSTTVIDLKSLNNSVVYWLHVPRDNIIHLKNSAAISTFYCYDKAFTTAKTTDTQPIRSHIKDSVHGGFSAAIVRSSTNFYVMMDY